MQHVGTVILETERLILRPFALSDANDMFNNWASDPEVTKYLMWPTHESVEITRQVLAEWVASYKNPDFYQWAIELKSLGQAIGSISVVRHNEKIAMVHVGYCIGKKWWKLGIMTEAFRALLRFFFEDVAVNRVEAKHDPRNPGSGIVMEKCGLLYEGWARQADWTNQGICDYKSYAILREDYFGKHSRPGRAEGSACETDES